MTPEQREELKPCPFCGSSKIWQGIYSGSPSISCDCGASMGGEESTVSAAILLSAWNRRAQVEALTVPQWISVEDELPDHGKTVAFVVDSEDWELMRYLHGRVLGGKYDADSGNFSVPGLGLIASYWKPMDAAPTIPAIPGTKEGA